jgi:amidohydrolase
VNTSAEALKLRACERIDRSRPAVEAFVDDVGRHAELGYREHRSASRFAAFVRERGFSVREGIAITGVRADVSTPGAGPTLAIIGELDGLPIPDHPLFSGETGGVHACGHHAQLGMVCAIAEALSDPDVRAGLTGTVALIATPAEESVEVDWRLALREQGKIEFLGGKQELIKEGVFDDVAAALMVHGSSRAETRSLALGAQTNGHVIKRATFIGKSAHAGVAPHQGVNALKAATLAIMAIDAQRETFRDADSIRVHPILTKGGDVVNAVPALAELEMYVRGRTLEAVQDANRKVDRALRGAAIAAGTKLRVSTMPGYLPLIQDSTLTDLFRANASAIVGSDGIGVDGHSAATTDMGDVSQLLPVIHPSCGGFTGTAHGNDFVIDDFEAAVLAPAKALVMTAIDLLADGAGVLMSLRDTHTPALSKAAYLTALRELAYELTEESH